MLKAIQHAHYVDGLQVAKKEVLAELASKLDQPAQLFLDTYAQCKGERTQAHMAETRRLMAQAGAQGFPGFVIQKDGDTQLVDHMPYYGNPQEFVDAMEKLLVLR